jgi:cation diffusion facilitator family transporter
VLHLHRHGAPGTDRALETTALGMKAVFVSMAALAATAAVELVVSLLSGSVALLADTVHNFADALTAVPLALAFHMGRRAPTRRYTYGFGRAEDLAGLAVVGMMAASTAVAADEAVTHLLHPSSLRGTPWVVGAALVGFAGNELVAGYRTRVGRRIGSAALEADGRHARADGLTSLAVVVGAVVAAGGEPRADSAVGLAITAVIALVLAGAARQVYRRLMDSVDPELVDEVESVLRSSPGIDDVRGVRIRWVGHELRAEADVVSDSRLSLVDAHAIATEAHHRLLHRVPRLGRAVIHTSPSDDETGRHHRSLAHHFAGQDDEPPRRDAPAYTAAVASSPSNGVVVEEATSVSEELVESLARLVPQLSSSAPAPSPEQVEAIVGSPATVLFVARTGDGSPIVGSLTLAVFRIPTGLRAWIEDVVVDTSARGRGVGSALVQAAVERARREGCRSVDLTSRPSREDANRLYQRLGFARRDTNVYRIELA